MCINRHLSDRPTHMGVTHTSERLRPYRRRVNRNYSDEVPLSTLFIENKWGPGLSPVPPCWWGEGCPRWLAIAEGRQQQHSKDIQEIHFSSLYTITQTEAIFSKLHVHAAQMCTHKHRGVVSQTCVRSNKSKYIQKHTIQSGQRGFSFQRSVVCHH